MKEKRLRSEINGYVVVYNPIHPKAMSNKNWKGWVYEHIMIAEKLLGRSINQNEEVHHLDLNRKNNKSNNLIVLEKVQHAKLHKWIQRGGSIDIDNKTPQLRCKICDNPLNKKQKFTCSKECKSIFRNDNGKMSHTSKKEVLEKLQTRTMVSVAQDYNISDNGLKRWLNKKVL